VREAGASEDEAVFRENLKRIVKPGEAKMPAEQTEVSFRGLKKQCVSQQEAYEWLLDKFLSEKAEILNDKINLIYIAEGSGRRFLAQTQDELYGDNAKERRHKKMSGGWYATMILDQETKLRVISRFAQVAGFKVGEDWSWDTPSQAQAQAEASALIRNFAIDL
jgi:hypothetical protein